MSGVFQNIDPPPPLHPASVSLLRIKGGVVNTRRAVRWWGVNIKEDARPWIGLLQFNPSTFTSIQSLHIAGWPNQKADCMAIMQSRVRGQG